MADLHLVAKIAPCLLVVPLLLACASVSYGASSALRHIWATDDGEKILRDDLNSPLKAGKGSSVWDGVTVQLFAARNETVAFQLILEAGDEGARQVSVTVSDLANGGARIRGSHPLPGPNDYRDVGVELFTEHYLHVQTPSYNDPKGGGFNWTAAANPKLTGWIPDALIPFSAAAGKGGAPFDIEPDRNQGVWVDIYVPRDAIPAGTYKGVVEVTIGQHQAASIPLLLEVLDLTLPDENHYHSMVFYSDMNIARRHGLRPGPDLYAMILRYHRAAHRHRIELIGQGTWEELEALKGTLTGEAFTRAVGYQGPGEGVGNSLFSINTYGVRFPDSEEGYRRESDRWVGWFQKNAPDVEYFLYLTDEPDKDRFDWVKERASWIHNHPGPGGKLPVFLTKWPMEPLVGAIDIWCSPAGYLKQEAFASARERGERVWAYAAYRPGSPGDVTDEYGIAFRLKPWIAHQHDIRRWFTWESTHWYPNQNEQPRFRSRNLFVDPVAFTTGEPFSTGNGDGILFYPGQDRVFAEEDRQYPGPITSIRMKMYRRGIQDVEYMWLAEQAGHPEQVMALIAELLPTTMWEAGELPCWSNSNAVYEHARRRLAQLALEK